MVYNIRETAKTILKITGAKCQMANLFISQVNVFHILINLAYLLQMLELSEFAEVEVQTLHDAG